MVTDVELASSIPGDRTMIVVRGILNPGLTPNKQQARRYFSFAAAGTIGNRCPYIVERTRA